MGLGNFNNGNAIILLIWYLKLIETNIFNLYNVQILITSNNNFT